MLRLNAFLALAALVGTLSGLGLVTLEPSGCPDPGHCRCNAVSGTMSDDRMSQFPINNGCQEQGVVP
jgi:hypothetical protein